MSAAGYSLTPCPSPLIYVDAELLDDELGVTLCFMTLSYYFLRAYASFRATILQREDITKPIRLVYRLEQVFDTQSKGVGYLMKPLE